MTRSSALRCRVKSAGIPSPGNGAAAAASCGAGEGAASLGRAAEIAGVTVGSGNTASAAICGRKTTWRASPTCEKSGELRRLLPRRRPAQVARQLPPLAPDESPELSERDGVGVQAPIGLDAPAQVGTTPRPQTIAAG